MGHKDSRHFSPDLPAKILGRWRNNLKGGRLQSKGASRYGNGGVSGRIFGQGSICFLLLVLVQNRRGLFWCRMFERHGQEHPTASDSESTNMAVSKEEYSQLRRNRCWWLWLGATEREPRLMNWSDGRAGAMNADADFDADSDAASSVSAVLSCSRTPVGVVCQVGRETMVDRVFTWQVRAGESQLARALVEVGAQNRPGRVPFPLRPDMCFVRFVTFSPSRPTRCLCRFPRSFRLLSAHISC